MKWCRVETTSGPSYGLVEDQTIALVEGSPFGEWKRTGAQVPLKSAKLLVPVIPPVFYAIGSNYHNHVVKMAEAFNRKPVFYEAPRVGYRANNALLPHEGDIVKPKDSSDEFQYEAELVAVIGKGGRNFTHAQAADCIRLHDRQRRERARLAEDGPDQYPRQELRHVQTHGTVDRAGRGPCHHAYPRAAERRDGA